ncbi:MAG: hypothetical protein PHF60_01915 [Candidatus ainarchaeum sp.]|nr:hypothetical protein [Candidatus ainarchaeum sp.]
MAGAIAIRSEDARIPALAMANRFTKFNPETEHSVRKGEIVDETLRQLKEMWDTCPFLYVSMYHAEVSRFIRARGLQCSAKDVERLSLAFAEFRDEEQFSMKAGVFLSALINNGNDTDYVVHTLPSLGQFHEIGWENTKNIVVKGDIESGGWRMSAGRIIVEGDVSNTVGTGMTGGTIVVEGNVSFMVGLGMEGGRIIVKGDVEGSVGNTMRDGEIYLEGDYAKLSNDVYGGKIYHKGELIVDEVFSPLKLPSFWPNR